MQIYVVTAGDNVDKIAEQFGVGVESWVYFKQLVAPYTLAVGEALLIFD